MKEINLNELRDRAYKNAVEHGFHDKEYSNEHYMCLVMTELAEAVQADRIGNNADFYGFENLVFRGVDTVEAFERYIKGTVSDELADVIIRLLDYAGANELDLPNMRTVTMQSLKLCNKYYSLSFTESIFNVSNELQLGSVGYIISNIIAIAKTKGIDNIMWFVEEKMRYNESRPYKHYKKY